MPAAHAACAFSAAEPSADRVEHVSEVRSVLVLEWAEKKVELDDSVEVDEASRRIQGAMEARGGEGARGEEEVI